MRAAEAVSAAREQLQKAGVENWAGEAKQIVAHILSCRVSEVLLTQKTLDDAMQMRLRQILQQRATLYPLQYILQEQEFMGLAFKVTTATLIPRGDTERIVEEAIRLMQGVSNPLIADVCCGSGAIAVSLAHFLPDAALWGLDISPEAAALAAENAARHQVRQRLQILVGDLLQPLADQAVELDMIIANPPYIRTGDLADLPTEVKSEPTLALDGGSDGLIFYRRLAKDAPELLKDGGWLLLETGFDQKEEVSAVLRQQGWDVVKTINDYGGNHRGIAARFYRT